MSRVQSVASDGGHGVGLDRAPRRRPLGTTIGGRGTIRIAANHDVRSRIIIAIARRAACADEAATDQPETHLRFIDLLCRAALQGATNMTIAVLL